MQTFMRKKRQTNKQSIFMRKEEKGVWERVFVGKLSANQRKKARDSNDQNSSSSCITALFWYTSGKCTDTVTTLSSSSTEFEHNAFLAIV